MAMSGGSSGELTSGSGDEAENRIQRDGSRKKKSRNPFKKVKKFFTRRSKNDTRETNDQKSGRLSTNLSLSVDSVFTTREQVSLKPLPAGAMGSRKNAAMSMEVLPQHRAVMTALNDGFLNRFKKEKKPSDSKNNALRNKRSLSDNDLDMETEHDFFESKWTVDTAQRPSSPGPVSEPVMDLDSVSNTQSLGNSGARHKLAVKPKNVRPSSQYRRPKAVVSPPVSPLPELKEESPPPDDPPVEELPPPPPVEEREPTPPPEPEVEPEEEPDKRASIFPPKTPVPEPEPEPEVKVEDNKENEEPVVEPEPEPVIEEPKEEPKKVEEPKPEEPGRSAFGGVVLRRTGKLKDIGDHGTIRVDKNKEKRQTIAVDAPHSVFGETKKINRSSVIEPKEWDKKDTPSSEQEGNNEFSQVLTRLKKRQSVKISELIEADNKSPAEETKPIVKEEPKVDPAPVVAPTPAPKEDTDSNKITNKPAILMEKPKPVDKDKLIENEDKTSHKKASPVFRDRERSKTMPSKEPEPKASPKVKRTNSQSAPANTPTETTQEKRSTLKAIPKVEKQQPQEESTPAPASTGPSWLAMAKRKTAGWDENRDPEKELKEATNKAKKEEEDNEQSRKSKVMDLMKNFQTQPT